MSAYLYLLPDKDKTKFKIGKTNNQNRIKHLSNVWNEIDIMSSLMFKYENNLSMGTTEKMLHLLYNKHNIRDLDRKDGHTEWFDYSCFDRVKSDIKSFSQKEKIVYVQIDRQQKENMNNKNTCSIQEIQNSFKFKTEYDVIVSINNTIKSHIKKLKEPLKDSISGTMRYCLKTNELLLDFGNQNLTIMNNELGDIISNLIIREHSADMRSAGDYYFSRKVN